MQTELLSPNSPSAAGNAPSAPIGYLMWLVDDVDEPDQQQQLCSEKPHGNTELSRWVSLIIFLLRTEMHDQSCIYGSLIAT